MPIKGCWFGWRWVTDAARRKERRQQVLLSHTKDGVRNVLGGLFGVAANGVFACVRVHGRGRL